MDTKDATQEFVELQLEPLRTKGHLVPDDWWEVAPPPKVSFWRRYWMFIVTVVIPVAASIVYLFFIASNQYVSEARFVVRENAGEKMSALSSLVEGEKMSRASDETYAVAEYLRSRDIAKTLADDDHLKDVLSRPEADMFNRFPNMFSVPSEESLYRRYSAMVDIDVKSASGIGVIEARAFRPEDARDILTAMLKHGEALVNRLNARAFQDSLHFAEQTVQDGRTKLDDAETRLTDFRNAQKVIDPNKEAAAALMRLGTYTGGLSELQVQLAQLVGATPNSPLIPNLRERIKVLQEEIDKERADIAGAKSSLATTMSTYDKLTLERELAQRMLESATMRLNSARETAEQQQLYLQTIVYPNVPDKATYPKRLLSLLMVAGLSLCVFTILNALRKLVLEHE